MNSHPQSAPRVRAFTLVELLTVIAIIAILMGLLFPAIQIAKEQARKAEARTAVTSVCAAVRAYNTEYGKYPLGDLGAYTGSGDVMFGMAKNQPSTPQNGVSFGSNALMFNILRGLGAATGSVNQYNPKNIVFFEGATATDSVNPKSGFAPSGAANPGAYMDPWGSEYFVIIDADYDNQIYVPYLDTTFAAPNNPRTGVGAFAIGKDIMIGTKGDGYFKNVASGTPSDDIISWQ